MANIDTEKFLDFVEAQKGKSLQTLARKAKFKVRVVKYEQQRGLEFKICSSGKVKIHKRKFIDSVTGHFNESESFTTTSYTKMTVNASYNLALIDLYLKTRIDAD